MSHALKAAVIKPIVVIIEVSGEVRHAVSAGNLLQGKAVSALYDIMAAVYYNEHNADLSRPYPGITEMLRSLQSHRILMAVASNKYQAATQKLIGHFFPDIAFTAILGQREGIPAKPHPQIVFEIMEKAGVEKKDTVYIGDSGVDMETGRNAGVDTIGVVWGFRPREELEAYRPQLIAHQCEDILKFLHDH